MSDLLGTGLSDDDIEATHTKFEITKVDFTAKDYAKLRVAHFVTYGKTPSVVFL
jgi:hypothetical protein